MGVAEINVIGIDLISTEFNKIDISAVGNTFKTINIDEINRPQGGQIDMLIGIQYAAYHPIYCEARDHLLLLQNRFGYVVAGAHPEIKEYTRELVAHATIIPANDQADQIFLLENLGINSYPACGNCRCGKCHLGGGGGGGAGYVNKG